MRVLAIIITVVAVAFLLTGSFIVVVSGGIKSLSPNVLLRLVDTSLLFAIAILLLTMAFKKKQ